MSILDRCMESARETHIDPLTLTTLFVETFGNGKPLGKASAFVVCDNADKPYLITNWHVLSGKNAETGTLLNETTGAIPDTIRIQHHEAETGKFLNETTEAIPDTIRIQHHEKGNLEAWTVVEQKLYSENCDKLWLEHSRGREVDVVALPLDYDELSKVQIYPMDMGLSETDILVLPGMAVSIIGFPLGMGVAGFFPIWKTGHIASDFDLDYGKAPSFLVDVTAREGMSGSPVVIRPVGSYVLNGGGTVLNSACSSIRFLGVYSSRICEDIEIGRVWKPIVINEILAGA